MDDLLEENSRSPSPLLSFKPRPVIGNQPRQQQRQQIGYDNVHENQAYIQDPYNSQFNSNR